MNIFFPLHVKQFCFNGFETACRVTKISYFDKVHLVKSLLTFTIMKIERIFQIFLNVHWPATIKYCSNNASDKFKTITKKI